MPATNITSWRPEPGWLLLLPSRLAGRKGNIYLPESYTKKNNSGICIAVGSKDLDRFIDRECFFPTHQEYIIDDTDTGYRIYVLEANKVLMTREPPPEIAAFSREKGQGITFETFERSEREARFEHDENEPFGMR
jgi:co-chaperonin GroES (HSP10)